MELPRFDVHFEFSRTMLLLRLCPCVAEQSHNNTENLKSSRKTVQSESSIFEQDNTGSPKPQPRISIIGKVVLGVTGAVVIGLVAITTPFVTPALRKVCLPYVPATERQIANVLQMCRPVQGGVGKSLVDLGSGDGRVV